MTRRKGIMGIFCQKRHFSNVFVIWGAGVGMLAVYGASCKTGDNLGS
jgi:hypothetical protein